MHRLSSFLCTGPVRIDTYEKAFKVHDLLQKVVGEEFYILSVFSNAHESGKCIRSAEWVIGGKNGTAF